MLSLFKTKCDWLQWSNLSSFACLSLTGVGRRLFQDIAAKFSEDVPEEEGTDEDEEGDTEEEGESEEEEEEAATEEDEQ